MRASRSTAACVHILLQGVLEGHKVGLAFRPALPDLIVCVLEREQEAALAEELTIPLLPLEPS